MMNENPLPGTKLLDWDGDLGSRMNQALHRYLDRKIVEAREDRERTWKQAFSSSEERAGFVAAQREKLKEMIGLGDDRLPPNLLRNGAVGDGLHYVEAGNFTADHVRWQVLEGISGEGLLLTPKRAPHACVIAIPDADYTPEALVGAIPGIPAASQFARRLAENGCLVLIPSLINREHAWSGNAAIGFTNQPHREWLYRQAYEMGRHVIGFEVHKVLSLVDWASQAYPGLSIGVAGYGEGGLLALYSAAIDTRVRASLVSGYYQPRENIWQEPVYRNIWGLLKDFGDAEIAALVYPRGLVIEFANEPLVAYAPPLDADPESGLTAAPGRLQTPAIQAIRSELERTRGLVLGSAAEVSDWPALVTGDGDAPLAFGSKRAISALAAHLGVSANLDPSSEVYAPAYALDNAGRQGRQVREIERFIQHLVYVSEKRRDAFFLDRVDHDDLEAFTQACIHYRDTLWHELIGRLEAPEKTIAPLSRQLYERERWAGYEVVLNVWGDVFAWGILLLPKDIQPAERRPVVVCQHGHESLPVDCIEDTEKGLQYYRRFAARLAERGFVVFAPHNPYRGGYRYKQLQRKANVLKASLGSIIVAQHNQIINWLETLPYVDKNRIAFYGLSYGGWTAVRIPPIIERYCLSICSAAFNDWIRKVTSVDFIQSYMAYADFEMCEWNAGHTFSNAEMAYLMVPRPFMVERGMHDPVAPDAWVASEYAKVRWLYTQLGLPDHTRIEFFNGEHIIHGEATFDFLHHHLDWPIQSKVKPRE